MAADVLIETEVDIDLNARASAVLATMGLTVSEAVVLLLNKIAEDGELPPDFLSASDNEDGTS